MRLIRLLVTISMLGASVALTGCGGGGAQVQTTNTTIGQELKDLKTAQDEGIITEKEYERAKEDILNKYD